MDGQRTWPIERQRQAAEQVLRAALAAVEPRAAVRNALRVDGSVVEAAGRPIPLNGLRRVLVVGAGKASAPMAAAVEEVFAGTGLPVEGVVVVKYGHTAPTRQVAIHQAGHPVPDQAGVAATREIMQLLHDADERDLVVAVISGGGSALVTLPEAGLSLADLQATTDTLLRCGAAIDEINAVRKHLDAMKGGGLARRAAPAQVLSLVLSDVVGNPLDVIASGPTVPDSSTWADALGVLRRYGIEDLVPPAVRERLSAGVAGKIPDTPKPGDPLFARAETVVVGSNLLACQAAAREAERLGLHALVLTTYVEGEAREVARVLAGLLREVHASGNPLPRPCCLVAGGETTVTVRGPGKGGRNQELALAAIPPLAGLPDVLLASIGTDGNDGPTDAAGGLVDGETARQAATLGLDLARHLAENDAYPLLERVGSLVRTGPTNTNVNDLYLLFAF